MHGIVGILAHRNAMKVGIRLKYFTVNKGMIMNLVDPAFVSLIGINST